MKILIVDDEAPARTRLRALVSGLGSHEVVGEAGNGIDAVKACRSLGPDVVLMDIRMPGQDGIAAASQIADLDTPPAIVFVTAYDDQALRAFETQAVDYVVKPVRRERLGEALRRCRQVNRAQLTALHESQVEEVGDENSILCRRRGAVVMIPVNTVRFFQADHKYITVNHAEGEDLIEDSLKRLEGIYPNRFIRIHRNALISREHLIGMEKDERGRQRAVIRDSDQRLEISRRHLSEVRQFIKERCG